ncbi:UDP-xylose transporter 2 [Lathyrus oleraceus]|uniref:UDP-xylose transporter 2 n=1 Tax=Pisum sativum TaxID=3888 RepID=UPI0021CFF25B|nr:UDP-xylose transporter 2-like [Pisum sativum]
MDGNEEDSSSQVIEVYKHEEKSLGSGVSDPALPTLGADQYLKKNRSPYLKVVSAMSTQLLYQSCPYQATTLLISGPYLDKLLTSQNVFAFKYTTQATVFIVLSCLISISVNFSTFLVIGKTSPVTYQVLGHLKTCLVLAFGYTLLHDPFSWRNIMGILLAMVGMILYSYYCTLENQQKAVEAATLASQAREGESDPLINLEKGTSAVTDSVGHMSPVWSKDKD